MDSDHIILLLRNVPWLPTALGFHAHSLAWHSRPFSLQPLLSPAASLPIQQNTHLPPKHPIFSPALLALHMLLPVLEIPFSAFLV